jgi:hypothetical protein
MGERQQIAVALPADLPGGLYWLKMSDGKRASAAKAIVVNK